MFNVIAADPPWKYDNAKTGGSMKSGAMQKYEGMTLTELEAVPVRRIADKDAILFLWATVPMLPEAIILLHSWGFKYKTEITWIKLGRMGLGYWFRGNNEKLLIGVRGHIPPFRHQHKNYMLEFPSRHSAKPSVFHRLVEDAIKGSIPHPRKIELFARRELPGWTCVGNEIQIGQDVSKTLEQYL